MNKLARHSGKMVAIAGALTVLSVSALAEIVYDNTASQNYLGQDITSATEFGDQINLSSATASRLLTNFRFDYYLAPTASGNESLTFKLYANDGVNGAPQTELTAGKTWSVSLAPGYNNVSFGFDQTGPFSVNLPETFTWSVLFAGVDGQEHAGLLMFDPPTIGSSFNDFWERQPDGSWKTMQVLGAAVNFSAQISAVPELGTLQYGLMGGLVWIGLAIRRRLAAR
jgi:hypothetical protein